MVILGGGFLSGKDYSPGVVLDPLTKQKRTITAIYGAALRSTDDKV